MSEHNIGELYASLELPVGTRFHFHDKLFEVIEFESKDEIRGCFRCELSKEGAGILCKAVICNHRHDGKCTYFRKVTEVKENNNG